MKKARTAAVIAASAAFAVALAGCATGDDATADTGDGILDIAISYVPGSLDPAISSRAINAVALFPVYEPLVRVGDDGELVPALATEWTAEEDNTRFTFTIRDDATFSNGEEVTPQAVVDSITYWQSGNGPFVNNLATMTSLQADGDQVVMELSEPNPDFLRLFTTDNLIGDIIAPEGIANPTSLGTTPLGAGPYVLDPDQTVTGNTYYYTANENYYDQDAIEWDAVKITVYEDATSAIQAMNTGQVDFMYTDASTANSNAATLGDGIGIASIARGWTGLMIMDREGQTDEALGDVRVRQALNYAVDRDVLTTALFGEYGSPTSQVVGPGYIGYSEANDSIYDYDPDRARELLEEAGYGDGVTITNALFQTPRNSLLTEALIDQFAQVGVTMEVDTYAGNADWRQAIYSQEYGTAVEGNGFTTPYLAQLATFDPGSPYNGVFGLEDPRMTELITTASALTGDEAEQAWIDAFTYAVEEAWFVPIATSDSAYFFSHTVAEPVLTSSEVDIVNLHPTR